MESSATAPIDPIPVGDLIRCRDAITAGAASRAVACAPDLGRPMPVRTARVSDRGSVTAFVALLLVALVALAGLVVDGGAAMSAHQAAVDEAQQAARAGAGALSVGRATKRFARHRRGRRDPVRGGLHVGGRSPGYGRPSQRVA